MGACTEVPAILRFLLMEIHTSTLVQEIHILFQHFFVLTLVVEEAILKIDLSQY